MSYNTRAGLRSNRPSYGNQLPSGGSNYSQNQQNYQNNSYTQPAYSTPTSYAPNKQNYQQNQQPPAAQQVPLNTKAVGGQQPATPQPASQAPLPQPPAVPQVKEPEPKLETDAGNDTIMDSTEDGPAIRGPKFRPWNKRDIEAIGESRTSVPPFYLATNQGTAGKISRKLRKRRQNARLRNLLAPKNAMMVLHELHPELKMVISEQVNAANQTAYTVEIEIDGKIFRGHGMSKMAAKQAASENALKAVLLEKLEQNNLKINPDNTLSSEGSAPAPVTAPTENQDLQMKEEAGAGTGMESDGDSSAPQRGKRPIEDDVPWGSLASFALFKLFSDWQSQGFQLPPSGLPPVFHKAAGAKKIPEDANKKHPVQLLNQIRPGSQYSETREGTPPNLTFKFTVVIDGQTYHGVGTNKKDAKKECAKRALEALGVKYE